MLKKFDFSRSSLQAPANTNKSDVIYEMVVSEVGNSILQSKGRKLVIAK